MFNTVALLAGKKSDEEEALLRVGPDNELLVGLAGAGPISAALKPDIRRLWEPQDLELVSPGQDSRFRLWRYITPAAPASLYSKQYSWEGCQDLTVFTYVGKVGAGSPTLNVALYASMVGGADFWSNAVNITPGSNFGLITAGANIGFNVISTAWTPYGYDATTVTNNASHRRGITYLYWGLILTPSAAGIPVTIFVEGR